MTLHDQIKTVVKTTFVLACIPLCTASGMNEKGFSPMEVNLKSGLTQGLVFDTEGRLKIDHLSTNGATGSYESAVMETSGSATITLDWVAQWITPQRWTKHDKNPIYGPKKSGAWDGWCNGVSIVRNPDGKTYKMFYAGKGGIGFADGSIADPLTWKENPASPVLRPRAGHWEGKKINQPRVVKLTDTHWRMFYTGWGFSKGKPTGSGWAFGVAESTDTGVTWQRVGGDPIIPRGGAGEPDEGATFVPEVRYIEGLWYMWYTAIKKGPGQRIHLCLATSTNGTEWVKHPGNPVLTDDFEKGPSRNVTSRCFVRHENGVFKMWYSHAKPEYRIRYAESLDGIHWERSPVHLALDASKARAWDDQMAEYPEVDVVDGQWRLWFCGNGFGSVGFATGIVDNSVDLFVRSGASPKPGADWSDWRPVTRGAPISTARHMQVRAILRADPGAISPALNRITLIQP